MEVTLPRITFEEVSVPLEVPLLVPLPLFCRLLPPHSPEVVCVLRFVLVAEPLLDEQPENGTMITIAIRIAHTDILIFFITFSCHS
jgi:hypothetical protein